MDCTGCQRRATRRPTSRSTTCSSRRRIWKSTSPSSSPPSPAPSRSGSSSWSPADVPSALSSDPNSCENIEPEESGFFFSLFSIEPSKVENYGTLFFFTRNEKKKKINFFSHHRVPECTCQIDLVRNKKKEKRPRILGISLFKPTKTAFVFTFTRRVNIFLYVSLFP